MSDDKELTAQPPARPEHLIPLIADASAGFRHAEVVVQQRLYNFLMAESILLLASAATIAVEETSGRRWLILAVSGLGVLIGLAWTVLGHRQRWFIDLHIRIVQQLEERFEHPLWRVSEPITNLRDGAEVIIKNKPVKLADFPLDVYLLWLTPAAFSLTFAIVFAIGWCGWM